MTDEHPSVSVVVVVGPPTPAPPPALGGLARAVAARPDAELVVVDDGTTSAVRAELTRLTGRVRIVHRLLATGPGEALATGADLAAGRLLVLVDPRRALPDGWLDAAVAPFADDPGIGVVGPEVAGTADAGAGRAANGSRPAIRAVGRRRPPVGPRLGRRTSGTGR